MSIEEFQQLSKPEKDETVMNYGTYLLNYDQDDTICDVYKVHQFYVKFCYDLRENTGPEITAFNDPDQFRRFNPDGVHLSKNN